jgi:hypothetical protein
MNGVFYTVDAEIRTVGARVESCKGVCEEKT